MARRLAVAVATAGLVVALSLPAGNAPSAAAQAPGLALVEIGRFASPTYVAHVPRRPRLLYVVEQSGTIRVVRRSRILSRPLLDIRGRVLAGGEAGLLSVAFHPRFPRNRSFFVYYVNRAGNIQVDRFRTRRGRVARATRARPGSRRRVIGVRHSRGNHFGGQLKFGPGGFLFLATGDGGGTGDPDGNAQNRRSLLGKLLRIRPRPRGGHRSPRSNPFVGRPPRNQIFSLGLRNPWRFSFDRATGDIWIADVGQDRWEEINRTTRGQAREANFGWNCREGPEAFASPAPVCASRSGFVEPVHAYRIDGRSECAVVGGYVARGRGAPPLLRGRYVYGDFCTGEIRSLNPADPAGTDAATGLRVPAFSLSSFGEGLRGRLHVASRGGAVHRIIQR